MAKTKLHNVIRSPEIRTDVDFVTHVENTLGWLPDPYKPAWKARSIEAAKLKRKRAQNPRLYSMDNLLLTVEYLRRQRIAVTSPAGVCWHVQRALEHAPVDDRSSQLDELINRAITSESLRYDDEARRWIVRLVRARGPAREDVYREWADLRDG